MAKLGELGKIITGNTPKTSDAQNYESNDICFVKPSDFTDNEITEIHQSEFYISAYAKDKARVLPTDSILVTCIGIIGKVAINKVPCAFNQQINAIVPEKKVCNPRYIAYAIENLQPKMQSTANAAVVPILNKTQFSNLEVPLLPVGEQKQIACNLNKIDKLIFLRKQQLAKLDELVKARFVEMFGDEQAFNKEPLSQNVEEMFIGPFGSSLKNESFVSKENGYCMVYEQKHAIRKTMDVETRYIDKPKYEELKRFSIHGGDIIVSCRGTIGETYIVPLNAPLGIMHPSIMKIRVKDSIYNRVFFDFLLQEKLKQHEAQANGSGVKMAVTASALGKEEFIVPSIPFQNQFAAFVERVDKQKQTVQQSFEKLELMKKALMQEYFG